nr:LysM peptidoglycan-binding domain-containing protein [Ralstonia insidiosa]
MDSKQPVTSVEDHISLNTWDALNRLKSQTNTEGTVSDFRYDSVGNVVATVDAEGTADQRTALVRYDALGRVTAQLSARGAALITGNETPAQLDAIWAQYATQYSYDAAGRRVSATDPNGNRTLFYYDQDGRLRYTVNAEGEVQERQYDAFGNLASTMAYGARIDSNTLTNLQGGVLSSDAQSLQAEQAFAAAKQSGGGLNSITQYTYNAVNELIATTDANGGVTTVAYDTFGDVVSSTQSIGGSNSVTTTRSYDRRGLQTEAVSDAGGANIVSRAQYDAFGRLIDSVDGNGNVSSQSFDRLGRVVLTQDPTNAQRTTSYDAFGRVLTQTDALGNTTQYSYNTANRSMTVTTPEGVSVTTTHNAEGQTHSVTDGNGNTTVYSYDPDGNLVTTTSPNGQSVSHYDQAGRLIETIDANGNKVDYTYDAANRLLSRTIDPNGLNLVTRYQYDAKGERVSTTDANGVVTQVAYDLKGQVVSQTVDPTGLNLTTTYTYDDVGHVLTVTDPKGVATEYVYDALGRRIESHVDPAGLNITRSYAYDADGNVVAATDGNGNTTRYVYDADSRLVYTVDAAGDVQQNAYDAQGRLTTTTAYANRVSLSGLADAPTLADVAGRINADPAHDEAQSRVYDADGRLHYTVDGAGSVVRYTYDANGNVVDRVAYANAIPAGTPATETALSAAVAGVADASRDAHVRNAYDASNRLIWSVDGTGAVVQRSYDANGNLTRQVSYANRVANGASPDSVAASADDRVTVIAYDGANRLTWQVDTMGGVTHLVYDANGNVAQRISYANRIAAPASTGGVLDATAIASAVAADSANDRTARAVFDAANRQVFSVDSTGAVIETRYDADGNVVQTTAYANRVNSGGLQVVAHLSDVQAQLQPDAANDRTTRHVFDTAGRLVYAIDAIGNVQQTEYDGAGRVVSTTLYANAIPLDTPATEASVSAAIHVDATGDQTNVFSYDAAGHLTSSTDPLGDTETYTWNGVGDKLSYTNKKGDTWTYAYDAAGRMVSESSPAVSLVSVAVDASGKLAISQAGSAPVITRLAYDALGNLVSRTEAAGRPEERTTQYRYDALGRQIQTIYPAVGVYNASGDDLAGNGADGVAARTDTVQQLSTSVVYDAFGDAVSNVDVAGNISYKTYDTLGRVSYDVDAMGYVTRYQRNTFGEVTALTRYADGASLGTAGAPSFSTAQVSLAVADLDHSNDRTIVTQYDQLGRAIQVTQPPTWVSNGSSYMASAVTRNTYNAFGQLVQSAALADPTTNTWAATTHYFDQDGRETATVDALGYVTTQAYDAAGNVVRRTEFANATSNWSIGSLTMPAVSDDDRVTTITYDQNNRKTSETRVNVEYSPSDNGISTRGDLTTSYGYDAVGNLTRTTDAKGHSTYTYYDAMGRTVAVAAPVRANTENGIPVTPLSVFYRDALGNAVVKIDFARGAASASESGYVPGVATGDDHVTFNQFDSHGNLTQTTDAGGNNHYYSYDALGHLAKQWMGVTGNDGVTHTLFSAFQYDALGRQTDIITPASTSVVSNGTIETVSQQLVGVIHTRMAYNGFGEMVLRGTGTGDIGSPDGAMHIESAVAPGGKISGSFVWQEHFDYDAAGHLWRTNSGDGLEKVFLYNLQGYQTAQITSKGQFDGSGDPGVNLTGFRSAYDVEQFGFETTFERRTDSARDLLGRVTQETLPGRFVQNVGTVRPVVYQTYDRWGNVVSQSDVRNAAWITTFRYNANNQVIEEKQPDGNGAISQDSPVTRLFYDALGQQVGVLDANGNFNGKVWDAGGNLVEEDHADGGTVQYDYDAFGNRTVAVDAMGNTTRYVYDSLGRNTAVINDVVNQYTVDGNNNVTGFESNDVVSMTYDQAGRKLSTTNGNGETTRFTYDLRGNVVATTQPMGEVSRAAFDALGHQIGALDANGALATWSYDAFGQLQAHTDIGGAVYWFRYDNARQLIAQGNSRYQSLNYQYDSAGQLDEIIDLGTGHITQYDYNLAGKHIHERTYLNTGAETYQDQTLAYDTLGRLAQVNTANGAVSLHFEYDKVGNRVLQQTSHTTYTTTSDYEYVVTGYNEAGAPVYTYMQVQHSVPHTTTQNLWYAYDSMNRQTLVDGAVNNNATDIANVVSGQGHILAYDKNGNRISDTSWGEQVVRQENIIGYDESGHAVSNGVNYVNHAGRITEYYTYDRMNRLSTVSTGAFDQNWQPLTIRESILLDTRRYDGASRVVETGPAGHLSNAYIQALTNGKSDANGAVTRVSRYDADGHLLSLHTTKPDGSFSSDQVYEKVNTWQTQEQVQTGTDESGAPIYTTQTVTHTSTSSGYDAAGNVTDYRITDSSGVTETFGTTYTKFEGYKEASVTGFRSDNAGQSGTTLDHYDVNGNLVEVEDTTKDANSRAFVNDANGNILQKTQQGNVLQQLVVDGQVYGTYGIGVDPTKPTNDNGDPNYTDLTNFNLGYQPITNAYPGAATGQYTIRAGDTLRTIAQSAYGDSELWYQIADANDIRSDSDLRVGQTLMIPNRVASAHNTSSSFKPYDPSKVVGDTTPNLPVPQQDDGGGCGPIGQIVMIVVAVVATIYTAGAAAGALGAAEGGAAAAGAAGAAGAGAAGAGSTFALGASVLSGTATGLTGLETVAVAAAAGAAGSVASQAVGNLIGAEHGFSWDQVAMGALGAGVTAGVGSAAVASGTWLAAQGSNTAGIVAGVGRAAIGSVVTQGLAVAVGLQDHFSWMQVATAAASSAVGSLASNAANDAMGYNPQKGFDFTKSLISGAAAGIAAGTTAAVMRGGRVQVEQIATDAFGNALGSSLAENADSTNSSQVQVLADTVSQQQPSGLVDPLYGISLGINPTYVNAPQPMFADMTAPYAGSSASAQEQELANTVSQPSGGLVDPLYGTSLGVNPTYASTPQSMFADTPAPYANAGESGQLQSVGVQPQMLAASWNGPVAPSYSNSTPVTDALTDAFPTSANGNPPSGEPLDAMGRDLARAGVFGPYSAAKAAADADPGVLLASVDVNRRPRDEMLLEGGGGGPGLGGGGGRSFAGESSGTGRAGLMDAAEAEGVAGARSIREGIYEFKTTDNEPYVGQSGNIDQRLQRHVENGKLNAEDVESVQRTEVLGGKTAREIAEHQRIQELTDGVPARLSPNVANKVDPIGPNRRYLLNQNR